MDGGTQPFQPVAPNRAEAHAEPPGSTGRSMGAAIILTIASWAIVSGMAGLWIRSTFLDPEGFANVVSQVIRGSADLQQQIGTEFLPAEGAKGQENRDQAEAALESVLSSGEGDSVLEEQLIALHNAIFNPDADDTTLDLSGLVEPVQAKLDEEGVDYLIPDERLSEIEIGFGGILQPVRSAAGFARTATLVLPVLGILLALAGLLTSDRRWRSLRWLGWNVAVSAGVIALFSFISRRVVSAAMDYGGVQGAGLDAAWGAMSQGLVVRMAGLALVGAAIAIVAWIVGKRTAS